MGAGLLERRDRFAGKRTFIHIGRAVRHQAVHREAFARFYQDRFPGTGRRAFFLQAHELTDGRRRTVLRPFLQQTPDEDEGDDHRRGFEIQMGLQSLRGPYLREKEVENAEKIGDGHGKGHKRVHVGASVTQGAETGLEKSAAAPENDRRRQGPQDESLPREILEPHAEQHHESSQHTGENGVFPQGAEGVLPGYLGF